MPAYNAARYLAAAVESVQAQTCPRWELIIVNDGSTDGTVDVLGALRDPRIRVFHQENRGQCAAANRALAEAKGQFIKFFDADDLLAPTMLERQLERLLPHPNCVASAEWGRFYGDDLGTFQLNRQSVWRDMEATDWLVESWTDARPMMQCALWLIPRALLDRTGGWDERLSLINDFEFFARVLCHAERVLFTPGCPLYYRSGLAGSLSGSKGRRAIESAFLSLTTGVDHLLNRRADPQSRLACANLLQDFIYSCYPQHPDLRAAVTQRINLLGRPTIEPSGGGKFQLARRLLGWRLAKCLTFLFMPVYVRCNLKRHRDTPVPVNP